MYPATGHFLYAVTYALYVAIFLLKKNQYEHAGTMMHTTTFVCPGYKNIYNYMLCLKPVGVP